jgi:hypothetical protein
MERKGNSIVIGAFLAMLGLFLAADAEAFCVYNDSTVDIRVQQTAGHKFGKGYAGIIRSGQKGCCNWSNSDCNTGGNRDSWVKFKVEHIIVDPWKETYKTVCNDFSVRAGGWLTVTDKCKANYN